MSRKILLPLLVLLLFALLPSGCHRAPSMPTSTPTPTPTPTPTSMPTPTSTPAPPADADPGEALERILTAALQEEKWTLASFLSPGSGPYVNDLYSSDCGERLREMLTALSWQPGEGMAYEVRDGEHAVHLRFADTDLSFITNNDTLRVHDRASDDPNAHISYHADGAERLAAAVEELYVGPTLRYYSVVFPAQTSAQADLESFVEQFRQSYLDSGAISDFRLEGEVGPYDGHTDHDEHPANLRYAVKPSRPTLRAWQDMGVDADGWVHFAHDIGLSEADRDGNVRLFDIFYFHTAPID